MQNQFEKIDDIEKKIEDGFLEPALKLFRITLKESENQSIEIQNFEKKLLSLQYEVNTSINFRQETHPDEFNRLNAQYGRRVIEYVKEYKSYLYENQNTKPNNKFDNFLKKIKIKDILKILLFFLIIFSIGLLIDACIQFRNDYKPIHFIPPLTCFSGFVFITYGLKLGNQINLI